MFDPVDQVGPGDAFVAAYLAEQIKGVDPHQRLVCPGSGEIRSVLAVPERSFAKGLN
ncbi:MAG TPA: hypothetical protein VJU61_07060 [Polyangiaceae bacterium]|nr:hypothetical protein [Polyangiaceae bacterium]